MKYKIVDMRFSFILLLGLYICLLFRGQSAHNNIALHHSYALEPAPNYALTADAKDAAALTDGLTTRGYFWTQKSTVGWENTSPVFITVDLGADSPICGASFDTAAGRAGVEYPAAILVLISTDDHTWYEAGDLVAEGNAQNGPPPASDYAVHRYWTDRWHTHGRWVRFSVIARGDYVFTDEVEIYEGQRSWLTEPLSGTPVSDFRSVLIQRGVSERMDADWQQLRAIVTQAPLSPAARNELLSALDRWKAERPASVAVSDPERFQAILPYPGRHQRLFQLQAKLWRACGTPPFSAWAPISLYDPLPYLSDGLAPAHEGVGRLMLMHGETRALTVDLRNARERAVNLQVRITGLPSGTAAGLLDIRRVVWTDTREGAPVASALQAMARKADSYHSVLEAGMTGQLWISVHPPNALPPGEYNTRIALETDAGDRAEIPFQIVVAPLDFPRHPALRLGVFDYTDAEAGYGLTPENRDALVALLQAYFTGIPWANGSVLPPGRFDSEGNLVGAPDTRRFDRWLSRWKDADRYYVYVAAGNAFAGAKIGTPEFDHKVGEWIRFWWKHAQQQGLRPGQIGLSLVDEPHTPEQDARIVAWASAIKQAAPEALIWDDPIWRKPDQMDSRLVEVCDLLCPNRRLWLEQGEPFAQFYRQQRVKGKALGLYSAGPLENRDPYAFYRLQAWQCFAIGAEEEHFWSVIDNGYASSWNPYLARRTSFTPLFLAPDSVTTAKPMEAIREGIEDYETLTRLREAVTVRKRQVPADPKGAEAERLLSEGVQEVLAPIGPDSLGWNAATDRATAARLQQQALQLLMEMRQ